MLVHFNQMVNIYPASPSWGYFHAQTAPESQGLI